ncbi:hypothetical protein ACFPLB_14895 [Aquamicrobium segne]|uniref:TFG box profile domain-containing protein n=1 Tax=Aquamicrobium segne TaxID=469547 RepID=A0ABW0GZZ4_9HYPH
MAGIVSGETTAAMRRAKCAAIAYVMAGLVALCGLGFLIAALYIWTASHYGALKTTIGFGVGSLVLAGLILLVFRILINVRTRQRRERQRKADMAAFGASAALAALPLLPALLRSRGGAGLLAGPALALLAYAIYRENKTPQGSDPRGSGPHDFDSGPQ